MLSSRFEFFIDQAELIIEKLSFLKGVDLDPWILAHILAINGARKYSYEIACIIASYNMLIHYMNCRFKDGFIYKQIEYYRNKIEGCLKMDTEVKIEILKQYVEKYKNMKK
jgi:hypothetical protein